MFSYTIIRSDRKTIAIQIKKDQSIVVRAPRRMRAEDIEAFVKQKTPWVEKHLQDMRSHAKDSKTVPARSAAFTDAELKQLTNAAKAYIPGRVAHFAGIMGVGYGRVCIKHQRTRWGSCSGKRNLNFNCLLMLLPREVLDYVVVHELCHLTQMNHSKRFWEQVARYCPDYAARRARLRKEGGALIARLPKKTSSKTKPKQKQPQNGRKTAKSAPKSK